ncbi:flavin oxidoreductase [Subtercola boreus]|uniref:Flavin oxidoreductase n=1 Tax=Subtercola boreus TaxID=120213 RepID=A0A3E0VF55_9MICO|nr:flavin reductase family protein [Subtercola boreus]RFA08542.1 flavin oxidoreductase [Subtercola boreus]TQL54529.1 flavin reductase (DIM6/NTAB) family NADH-FMN oxidoreductase RutF [Subtercola boreus]
MKATPAAETEAAHQSQVEIKDFTGIFRDHPSGVAVVTADIGDGPVGLTATSVISVSVNPPLLVFSLSELSSSTPTLLKADTVVVHLLGVADLDIARLCSTSGIDRFADTTLWSRLETGEPLFGGVDRWIRARVVQRIDAGTATVMVVEALEVVNNTLAPESSFAPLVYHNRTWHALGDHSAI